jgi:hypothetical protein
VGVVVARQPLARGEGGGVGLRGAGARGRVTRGAERARRRELLGGRQRGERAVEHQRRRARALGRRVGDRAVVDARAVGVGRRGREADERRAQLVAAGAGVGR